MAWERWQEWYAELKGQQYKTAGAIRRMLNRKLSMAWETWQQVCEEMRRQRELLASAMRKFMRAKLFLGWNSWRAWWEEQKRIAFMLQGCHCTPGPTAPRAIPNFIAGGFRCGAAHEKPAALDGLGKMAV